MSVQLREKFGRVRRAFAFLSPTISQNFKAFECVRVTYFTELMPRDISEQAQREDNFLGFADNSLPVVWSLYDVFGKTTLFKRFEKTFSVQKTLSTTLLPSSSLLVDCYQQTLQFLKNSIKIKRNFQRICIWGRHL